MGPEPKSINKGFIRRAPSSLKPGKILMHLELFQSQRMQQQPGLWVAGSVPGCFLIQFHLFTVLPTPSLNHQSNSLGF